MHQVAVPCLRFERLLHRLPRHRQDRGPRSGEPTPQVMAVPSSKIELLSPLLLLWPQLQLTMTTQDLAGYRQQDAHEYFQFMLDQLHQMSVCAEEKDSRSCECLYHQSFYGKFRSTVTCLACKNVTTAGDPFIDLSLDLHHQAKRRKLGVGLPSNEAPLELTGCLGSFTSSERLPPDAYTCKSEKCQNTPQRAIKHVTIKKLPPSLCIQLKVSILPALYCPSPHPPANTPPSDSPTPKPTPPNSRRS